MTLGFPFCRQNFHLKFPPLASRKNEPPANSPRIDDEAVPRGHVRKSWPTGPEWASSSFSTPFSSARACLISVLSTRSVVPLVVAQPFKDPLQQFLLQQYISSSY